MRKPPSEKEEPEREGEAAKEGAGALRPDSLAALGAVQCEIEMGKGDRAGKGEEGGGI